VIICRDYVWTIQVEKNMQHKYLYYTVSHGAELYRTEVIRETNDNVWVKKACGTEMKVSKKTMCFGSRFERIYLQDETTELKEKFLRDITKRKFLKKLKELEDCDNISIMREILTIQTSQTNEMIIGE
jgi:hypothetical protein